MSTVNLCALRQTVTYRCNEMDFANAFSEVCSIADLNLTDEQINEITSIAMESENIFNQILQRTNPSFISKVISIVDSLGSMNQDDTIREIRRDFFYFTSDADSSGNIIITAITEKDLEFT